MKRKGKYVIKSYLSFFYYIMVITVTEYIDQKDAIRLKCMGMIQKYMKQLREAHPRMEKSIHAKNFLIFLGMDDKMTAKSRLCKRRVVQYEKLRNKLKDFDKDEFFRRLTK